MTALLAEAIRAHHQRGSHYPEWRATGNGILLAAVPDQFRERTDGEAPRADATYQRAARPINAALGITSGLAIGENKTDSEAPCAAHLTTHHETNNIAPGTTSGLAIGRTNGERR